MKKTVEKNDTPEKGRLFLSLLAEYGNVTHAAKESGWSRVEAYRLRDKDSAFREAWEECARMGVEALEDEARRRAYLGTDRPVFHQGEVCGTIRQYSDTLLIFLLKAHKPEVYGEKRPDPVATGNESDTKGLARIMALYRGE